MKLYVVSGSPNARKVQSVAGHLGLEITQVFLDFSRGDTKSPGYLEINPTGRVPALEDDGFVLWESNAINKYLCSKCPDNTLYPVDPRVQADIDRWLSWELAHYNQQLGILTFQTVVKPNFFGQPPDAPLVAWSVRNLRAHADVLERHLEGKRYLVGDDITLADYAMIHVELLKDMTSFDWSPYPNINDYYDRMRAVPHWARTAVPLEEAGRIPADAIAFAA